MSDGKTPYARRFKTKFPHKTFPFGAEVKYRPSSPAVRNQMHPMGPGKLRGIFMGYHLNEGGFFIGDCQVADWEDIAKAERVRNIPVRRVKMKEVDLELFNGKPRFPIAEGIVPQPITLLNADRQRNRTWEPPELQLVNNEEEEIDLDIGLKRTGESLVDEEDDDDDVEPIENL